jgi:hypothetical protein
MAFDPLNGGGRQALAAAYRRNDRM